MCTDPGIVIVNQEPIPAKCRKCDECRSHQRRLLLGKVLAEQQTAKEVWFSTYTYAGGYGNAEAYQLNYKHMTDCWKRMRKAGLRFKYLVVGEYGDEKERAHWHALIFWESDPPKMPMGQRTEEAGDGFWHKGYVQHEYPRSKTGAGAYCMKYLEKNNTHYKKNVRKSTGMGEAYLCQMARRTAAAGLPLFQTGNTFVISEQTERARSGQQFFYPVERTSATYHKMMRSWLGQWAITHAERPLRHSDDTRVWYEDLCQEIDDEPEHVQRFIERHDGYEATSPTMSALRYTMFTHPDFPYVVIEARRARTWVGIQPPREETTWLLDATKASGVLVDPRQSQLTKHQLEQLAPLLQPLSDKLRRLQSFLHRSDHLQRNRRPKRPPGKPQTATATST